jgi:hypothetical protein
LPQLAGLQLPRLGGFAVRELGRHAGVIIEPSSWETIEQRMDHFELTGMAVEGERVRSSLREAKRCA